MGHCCVTFSDLNPGFVFLTFQCANGRFVAGERGSRGSFVFLSVSCNRTLPPILSLPKAHVKASILGKW